MEPITIRVDEELQSKLDSMRGDKKKSEFYREILEAYVNTLPHTEPQDQHTSDHADQKLMEQLSGQVRFLEGKLDEANRLLLNEQTLHLATQRLLPLAQNKPWYKFWK